MTYCIAKSWSYLQSVIAYWLFQDDDSYILPVLLRFEGQPEVNEEVCLLVFQTY